MAFRPTLGEERLDPPLWPGCGQKPGLEGGSSSPIRPSAGVGGGWGSVGWGPIPAATPTTGWFLVPTVGDPKKKLLKGFLRNGGGGLGQWGPPGQAQRPLLALPRHIHLLVRRPHHGVRPARGAARDLLLGEARHGGRRQPVLDVVQPPPGGRRGPGTAAGGGAEVFSSDSPESPAAKAPPPINHARAQPVGINRAANPQRYNRWARLGFACFVRGGPQTNKQPKNFWGPDWRPDPRILVCRDSAG